ncbi:carboxypeptidase [Colwellia asteriadis]|uniref:Carboxypeptidase n=1 Tax=Colwellia asteriadis TaxID=517723 RepID=A0ABP3WK60_9GAMM
MKSFKHLSLMVLFVGVFSSSTLLADNERKLSVDDKNTTKHSTKIKGERIKYTATTGTQPVWDEEGTPTASLFYTYYQRTDVDDKATRPLLISFNGGPGSASVWMHIAYTGPKVINVDNEGYPLQPYGVKTNPYSILDVADIVFVNPVNTGYSRALAKKDGSMPSKAELKTMFFGVNADIKYLADWVSTFVTRNERWRSPKYLIGESYGTTRVAGLTKELQSRQWMYINGTILVSPTDIGIKREGPVKAANRLPYFAATAWYHNALTTELQQKPLAELLAQVEQFTLREYLPALAQGGFIAPEHKQRIAEQVAKYAGLSVETVVNSNLDISNNYFWKDLLRNRKQTVGRLDSRYLGIDKKVVGARPDYNAELSSWLHSFTPAINHYLREELGYKTDLRYNMFGNVHPWDRSGNNTGENLRLAMAENPYLNVMVQSGYFDGATNYFDAKYTMWQLDPSGQMKDRLSFKGYESGHMMYLRHEDLRQSNQDIRDFIIKSTPAKEQAAKY